MERYYNILYKNNYVDVVIEHAFDYSLNENVMAFYFSFHGERFIDSYRAIFFYQIIDKVVIMTTMKDLFNYIDNNLYQLETNLDLIELRELKKYFKMELNPAKTILERIKNG